MEDIWNDKRIITIDLLGDEFLGTGNTGDPIVILSDSTLEIRELVGWPAFIRSKPKFITTQE